MREVQFPNSGAKNLCNNQAVDIMDLLGSRCVHSHGMCTDVSLCMHNLTLLRFNRCYFASRCSCRSCKLPGLCNQNQLPPLSHIPFLDPDPSQLPAAMVEFLNPQELLPSLELSWSFIPRLGPLCNSATASTRLLGLLFGQLPEGLVALGSPKSPHAFTYHCLVDSKKHGLMASFIFCLMSS